MGAEFPPLDGMAPKLRQRALRIVQLRATSAWQQGTSATYLA